ncbi:MAG: glycosyltransferase family 4 protein [Bryobacteraceae bacterium]|jgi:sugar transferase (PEP-CTERM/EpsH1 system associated)
MKLLWVKAGGLLPPDMGGKIRSYQILKQLARRHEVTLFTFYQQHPDDQHLRGPDVFSKLVAVPLPLPPRRSLGEYARAASIMAAGRPATVHKFLYPEVRRRYAELTASAACDVIVCDFIVPAPLMHWRTSPPTILFTHNVEAQIWERHCKIATDPFMKTACWLEARALARTERHYVELADHVLTVSDNDRAFFLRYVRPERISVIPTGVDTEYFKPSVEPEQPGTMVFTGSMDWMPNEDGVAYFVDKILPLIHREIPAAAFWAVGRRPPRRVQNLASDHVVVTGAVDDIRPHLGKAAVCVVPLRSGSGTRIKIFEAMAMGKAVVSTTMGAEGLPVRHGENIILADEPIDFARQVVQLLQDPLRRAELGDAARQLVEQNYSWESVASTFDRIMHTVVHRPRS